MWHYQLKACEKQYAAAEISWKQKREARSRKPMIFDKIQSCKLIAQYNFVMPLKKVELGIKSFESAKF